MERLSPSRLERYGLSLISEPARRGRGADTLRGVLRAAAATYNSGLKLYLRAEAVGLRRRERLPVPVISVGNLTVGGAGKTPMTQLLCRRLAHTGRRLAILSRGHGGTVKGAKALSDLEGRVLLDVSEAGDEPTLLARTLPGIPVVVGKDRRESGRLALRNWACDALVLDDGFQYWQLARDLDIVLIDTARPFDNGYSLPRGLLREPPAHLRRAQIVVATRAEAVTGAERDRLRDQVCRLAPGASLYFADHRPAGLTPVSAPGSDAIDTPTVDDAPLRVVGLCGIAQPTSFARTVQDAGLVLTEVLTYPDHATYSREHATAAADAIRETGADALVMTEKDAVKWGDLDCGAPAYALRVEMAVEGEQSFINDVIARAFTGAGDGK